jgi:5,10-methylenetetrahydromethanopterin reductase
MELSCGLPPRPDLPELAELAEELGYSRLWLFDSAPLWEDTFVHLALAAQRTTHIGLATAVLAVGQRSALTTASAIATIARMAPGRLRCAFGTGFTARIASGDRPLPLRELRTYVDQIRALLAGETVDVDGRRQRMLHVSAMAAPRPVDVPLWVSVFGPMGRNSAAKFADGAIVLGDPLPDLSCAEMISGTVLEDGEGSQSNRVRQAVAPWRIAPWHMVYATAGAAVDQIPGGRAWRERLEAEASAPDRHLLIFEGHATHIAPRDEALVELADYTTMVGTVEQLREQMAVKAGAGLSEIIYTPAGPDLARELRAFRAVIK